MNKKVALCNLGCKVNASESEAMRGSFMDSGYETVPFSDYADIYIINTCCVTAVAEKKSRQMIHRARKLNSNAVIAAVGCYSQVAAQSLLEDGTADIIIGASGKKDILEIIESGQRGIITKAEPGKEVYEEFTSLNGREHTRGFIKIEDGCENFCSYCIIPYARGKVRSREQVDVLSEVRTLAEEGCLEVVLSGINISAYGRDQGNKNALRQLIRSVAEIDGIERVRLGSIEPVMITEEFLDDISSIKEVCPHFHLSLQSGCGKTLRAMNRRYTPEDYRKKCSLLRTYYQEPSITTDIIVGFPGETETDFKESFDFVRSIGFFETHVFPYSRREGTKAALMDDQLTLSVKKARVAKLLKLNDETRRSLLQKRIGSTLDVLLEEEERIGGNAFLSGHTGRYEKVLVPGENECINHIKSVRISKMDRDRSGSLFLEGVLI